MSLSLIVIALCLALGGVAAFALRSSFGLADLGGFIRAAEPKSFSPRNTLFIIGPSMNHPACRLQRRLLKPAVAALIREDVSVIEVYGNERPRRNGEDIDWLDAPLLRHALDAEGGFFVVYVDASGKTAMRSEAPIVTADLLERAGLDFLPPGRAPRRKSAVLKRLRAA